MFRSQLGLRRSLTRETVFSFAGVFNKRKPIRKDLDKYDVVIIGCNLGGILSRQLDNITHGKYKTMVVLDENVNQMYPIRQIYEQQRCAKTDYILNAKLSLNMYTAHSENIGCQQILPNENAIVLRNGRKIEYDHLVVAMGMQQDVNQIKGLENAWKDLNHPVFTQKDHPSWRSVDHKYTRWHYNFNHGDAYFVIPPYPYAGEVESYNFLLSQSVWKWQQTTGRQSPIRTFTIVNANERFVQYNDSGDQYFKDELKRRGVRVEYGLKLVEVNKEKQLATFEDLKTGAREIRNYNHLLAITPTKPHEPLVEAGLTSRIGLLDVDEKTLRHRTYKNIFGLGDVCDVPTTKGTWAGFHQMAVVRNNLQRSLQGQTLNAEYDGYSKIPILLSQNTITFLCHKYNNENAWHNLKFSENEGNFLATLRYSNWVRNQKKSFMDIYLGKSWGPPYYKFKKSFKSGAGEGNGFLSKLFSKKTDTAH